MATMSLKFKISSSSHVCGEIQNHVTIFIQNYLTNSLIDRQILNRKIWIDGLMAGWMDSWMVGWMDSWMVGWMDGLMDE